MLSTKGKLIFPTAHGNLNGHMLRMLKSLAKKAGLNGEFKLHKTYATRQHRDGVDAGRSRSGLVTPICLQPSHTWKVRSRARIGAANR
jgi:hypothetical protein